VPADAIRELAHAWGNSKYPQMCWTLGITEHHNAVDNVLALINLSLLVGGVGRPNDRVPAHGRWFPRAARPKRRRGAVHYLTLVR